MLNQVQHGGIFIKSLRSFSVILVIVYLVILAIVYFIIPAGCNRESSPLKRRDAESSSA